MPEPLTMTALAAGAATAAEGTGAAIGAADGTAAAVGIAEGMAAEVGAVEGIAGGLAAAPGSVEAFIGTLGGEATGTPLALAEAGESGAVLEEALRDLAGEAAGVATEGAASGVSVEAFDAPGWVEAAAPEGVVGPQDLIGRFRALAEPSNMRAFAEHLDDRDPAFARELGRRELQFREASTAAEKDAALDRLRKSTSGQFAEAVVRDGFRPYFRQVDVQVTVETGSGLTRVDIIGRGAFQPMILGRGLSVPAGGDLAIEVKAGMPGSLVGQLRHAAAHQVLGHNELGGRSLVLVTRDVHGMAGERAARGAVAEAGSRVIALLPPKGTIDRCLVELLARRGGDLA